MGFLYQVLKDVSEKQPYKVGKETLNEIVSSVINNHLCSGHEGFKRLLTVLPDRIAEYNREVQEGNKYVKTPIKNILDYAAKTGELLINVNNIQVDCISGDPDAEDEQVTAATKLLNSCVLQAKTFEDSIRATHDNILDLNHELKIRVMNAKNTVVYERDRLSKLGQKEKRDLDAAIVNINQALKEIQKNVNSQINQHVKWLVEELREKVKLIKEKLADINSKLSQYARELGVWMQENNKLVNDTKEKYLYKIIKKNVGVENQSTIRHVSGAMEMKAKEIQEAYKNTQKYIEWMVNDALIKVKEMDSKLKYELNEVKKQIISDVGIYVRDELLHTIKKSVDDIKGNSGLDGVVQHVKVTYATEFKSKFEGVVQRWIDDILKNNGLVKEAIGKYISVGNQRGYKFNDLYISVEKASIVADTSKYLAAAIKDSLGIDVKSAKIPDGKQDNVEGNIEAVSCSITSFVKQLKQKIEGGGKLPGDTNQFISSIADSFEKAVSENGVSNYAAKSFLIPAIVTIISALYSKANQAAQELESFTGKTKGDANIGQNVDKAWAVANKLGDNLENATNKDRDASPAAEPFNILQQISEKVEAQLPGNDGNPVKLEGASNFTGYRGYVKQDGGAIEALLTGKVIGEEGENLLPSAIGAIKYYGLTKLKVTLDKIARPETGAESTVQDQDEKGELYTLSDKITNNLTQLVDGFTHIGTSIRRYLDHFTKESIGVQLKDIVQRLENLQTGPITDALNAAYRFVDADADMLRDSTIKGLKQHVDKQINFATISLTHRARIQYVTSIKDMVKAFSTKVRSELHQLPEAIDSDLSIGFKGFMSALEGDASKNIRHLQYPVDLRSLCHGFEIFFSPLKKYIDSEIKRVHENNNLQKNPNPLEPESTYTTKMNSIYSSLSTLTGHIITTNRYDHKIPGMLSNLMDAVNTLKPQSFEQGNTPILDGVTDGLGKFVDEMRKAYIGTYDGATPIDKWEMEDPKKKKDAKKDDADNNMILTKDGRNGAKVFLTCVTTLFTDLYDLYFEGGHKFREEQIQHGDKKADFRDFLTQCGYNVKNLMTKDNTGWNVAMKLSKKFRYHNEFDKYPNEFNSLEECADHFKEQGGILSTLYTHLHEYYQVCHYATLSSTKQPTSVYAMLQWLSGLTYNPAHKELLFNGFGSLFEKKESNSTDGDGLIIEDDSSESLSAYPHDITVATLTGHLAEVCHNSHDVLTSILGHGHADGVYACDFNANPQGFSYPANSGQCIDMLVDVLCRLYQQLYFLYCQCCNDESCSGWRDCWYGNAVGGSSWKCNNIQCPDQKAKQTHRQKCDQNCNQTANCGIKSPLQSFLEDGLPGFLPHKFTKPGCKLECAMSNHRGIPCMTPMGFSDISITASHRQKGEHLKRVLADLCGNANSPLSVLCASFRCLMNTPPKNLGDIFAFYQSFLTKFTGGFYGTNDSKTHTQDAFNDAVTEAYFGNQYNALVVSTLCNTRAHNHSQSNGDLVSITVCKTGTNKPCGLYVQPLTLNTYSYYSSKHKTNHLSWIVYITETFYDLLKKLYDDCCGTCKKPGSRCYDKCCTDGCKVKAAYAAIESNSEDITAKKLDDKDHDKNCKSIVHCRNTHPNLYKYGFTFGNPLGLSGIANNTGTLRTCKDFCEALKLILGKESVLITLRGQIDEFLWAIRTPFSYLVLALWLLSFLYLIHIMVIRLDLLHIKSHLHSTSSHRIAAQSLLAAGRVNKLNRVFYLQP